MSQMDGDAALCRQWLADEQRVHERAECAPSSAAVSDALREQTRRVKLVRDYETKVNRAKADAKDDGSRQELSSAYTELVSVAQHQKTCIEARVKVASLEQAFSTLSTEFSQRAAQLVQRTCQPDTDYQQTGGVGLGRAAQGCVLAMKDSWDWLQELHRCSQLQLQHAATYHQFYHSAREYACWMPDELQRSLDALRDTAARADDVHKLVLVLKETVTRFAHWQTKMAALLEASGHVVPVHLRTAPLQHYRPITALAAYKSSQIKVHAGEELTLLDNSDAAQWRVRNTHCDEARLPSVICLIPGLDPDAVALVTRLRIKLLSMWTLCIRASGNALIQYFLYVFKDWDDNQKQKLVSLLDDDKLSMRAVMRSVEEVLGKYWSGQAAWGTLVGRLRATGTLLLQQGNAKDHDKQFSREYKGHISNIEEILLHFMSCLRQWDTYRLLVETSRHSDHVLLVDSWRHLKFFNTAQVLEESEMSLFDGDAVDARLLDQSDSFTAATVDHVTKATPTDVLVTEEGQSQFGSSEIGVEKTIELKTGAMIEQTEETETTETTVSTEVTQETEVTEVAETEELHHAEGEESRTFVITDTTLTVRTHHGGSNMTSEMTSPRSPRQPGDGQDRIQSSSDDDDSDKGASATFSSTNTDYTTTSTSAHYPSPETPPKSSSGMTVQDSGSHGNIILRERTPPVGENRRSNVFSSVMVQTQNASDSSDANILPPKPELFTVATQYDHDLLFQLQKQSVGVQTSEDTDTVQKEGSKCSPQFCESETQYDTISTVSVAVVTDDSTTQYTKPVMCTMSTQYDTKSTVSVAVVTDDSTMQYTKPEMCTMSTQSDTISTVSVAVVTERQCMKPELCTMSTQSDTISTVSVAVVTDDSTTQYTKPEMAIVARDNELSKPEMFSVSTQCDSESRQQIIKQYSVETQTTETIRENEPENTYSKPDMCSKGTQYEVRSDQSNQTLLYTYTQEILIGKGDISTELSGGTTDVQNSSTAQFIRSGASSEVEKVDRTVHTRDITESQTSTESLQETVVKTKSKIPVPRKSIVKWNGRRKATLQLRTHKTTTTRKNVVAERVVSPEVEGEGDSETSNPLDVLSGLIGGATVGDCLDDIEVAPGNVHAGDTDNSLSFAAQDNSLNITYSSDRLDFEVTDNTYALEMREDGSASEMTEDHSDKKEGITTTVTQSTGFNESGQGMVVLKVIDGHDTHDKTEENSVNIFTDSTNSSKLETEEEYFTADEDDNFVGLKYKDRSKYFMGKVSDEVVVKPKEYEVDSDEGIMGLFAGLTYARACCLLLPLLLLLGILLVLFWFPVARQECRVCNSIENSFSVMLIHNGGPPPF